MASKNNKKKSKKRGLFVVFEGIDRSGKTSQVELLVSHLKHEKKIKVKHMRFPDRSSPIGEIINQYLTKDDVKMNDPAIHLLFSCNRWEKSQEIEKTLLKGTHIIADRYTYSGVAFSHAKGTLTMDFCKSSDEGLPAPDIIIYLDLPVSKAKNRGNFGQERYEIVEFQEKVYKNYQELQKNTPSSVWYNVDAEKKMDQLHMNIRDIIYSKIKEKSTKPINYLWDYKGKKK
jgi:dTMP kinase